MPPPLNPRLITVHCDMAASHDDEDSLPIQSLLTAGNQQTAPIRLRQQLASGDRGEIKRDRIDRERRVSEKDGHRQLAMTD